MKKCLDEATIQAYADGELPAGSAQSAAAHLAQCDACAAAFADAERQGALFAAAFAPDANVNVPTQLLRARINAAVAQLEAAPETSPRRARGRDFGALLAPLAGLFSFTPRRGAAFASVLALVAFGVFFFAVPQRTTTVVPQDEIARDAQPQTRPAEVAAPGVSPQEAEQKDSENEVSGGVRHAPPVVKASAPRRVSPRRRPETSVAAVAATPAEVLVPGEKNYREAIASLEKIVEVGGDAALVPSARIEYERTIAVLDRAIDETRRAALRNPKDKDAVGFLMTAYQSKVELLTTVAEQTQVAAAGR
jgi:hypothetical protein